jgi:hypothetical protein
MVTVCGLGRRFQRVVLGRLVPGGRSTSAPRTIAAVRPLAGARRPLIGDRPGAQRRGGAQLDQVDGTTCGSAVLVALAAWADPTETLRLDGELGGGPGGHPGGDPAPGTSGLLGAEAGLASGFGARFDARQKQVHRESTRFWPRALGTSPWGMAAWLRRNAPAAGPYRVRLVDDTSPVDVERAASQVGTALAAGRPVPLLIGGVLPRHYVLAVRADAAGWLVYEPGGGQVVAVGPDAVRGRALGPLLGFDRWHAVLLPA